MNINANNAGKNSRCAWDFFTTRRHLNALNAVVKIRTGCFLLSQWVVAQGAVLFLRPPVPVHREALAEGQLKRQLAY